MDAQLTRSEDQGGKRTPLKVFEVPLEIFLILNHAPNLAFTVKNIQSVLFDLHGDQVGTQRIRQVCESMADRGRIVRIKETHPKTHQEVKAYKSGHDPAVLIGHPLFSVSEFMHKFIDLE